MAVGRVVLVAGILILLFIPYLLWGTGLMTARSQSLLRSEFGANQHASGSVVVNRPPSPATPPAPQLAATMPDPAVGAAVGIISIPKIGLSMVVVEGTGEAQLQQGPGHYPGTPMPGEAGNSAIAGHRTTYLHPFYSIDALAPGDPITLTTLQGVFVYNVTGNQVVDPTDVGVVGPTATPQLTLTTCNPRYSAAQRLVVHALLVASTLTHPVVVPVATTTKHHTAAPPPPPSQTRRWVTAVLWGVAVAVLISAVWVAARRTHRMNRAGIIVGGLLAWLAVVFFFFEAVAPLLPASY